MKPRLLAPAAVSASLLLAAACGGGDPQQEIDRQTVGAAETPPAQTRDLFLAADGAAEVASQPDATVVFVGAADDFAAARIPGARLLPLDALRREVDGVPVELPPVEALDSVFEAIGIGDEGAIVLYGDPLPAARAFFTLDVLGHGNRVHLLDGGLDKWTAAGHPVERGGDVGTPAAAAFTPRTDRSVVVDAEDVEARIGREGVALLDARPAAQFTGEQSGDGIARGGHIPGAVHLFWEEMRGADGTLLPEDSLRSLLASAGVQEGDTLVTYCRTGMQASYAYAVARALGYESRMYDGSMVDWAADPARPISAGTE